MNHAAASSPADDRFAPDTIARWRVALWTFAALLLATPWVAMRFTDEVRWDAMDFLVFGAMLLMAGGLVELVVRLSRRRIVVLGAVALVGAAFLLVWAELAVGVWS
jgi:peptidoglycan/LPS O-acetylase OafA/YrhL